MAEELSREINLGAGTVTLVLKDEFGCLSKHTVNIADADGLSVDELSARLKQERKDRVTNMLPHLEKLSPDHAQLATNIRFMRDAG